MKRWLACIFSCIMILNCVVFPVYAEEDDTFEDVFVEVEAVNEPEAYSVEEEAPVVKENVPEAEPETPVVEEKIPETEPETPVVEAETPEAEPETPAVEEKTPEAEPETPAVEEKTPEVEPETPDVEEKTPEVEPETPAVEEETPEVEPETPTVEEETLEDELKTPIAGEVLEDVPESIVIEEENLIDEDTVDEDFQIDGETLLRYTGEDLFVVVPDGVKYIGERAFYQNKKIIHVSMPSTVEVIKKSAFEDCENLQNVVATGLKTIESKAFWGCEKLDRSFAAEVEKVAGDAYEVVDICAEVETEIANITTVGGVRNDSDNASEPEQKTESIDAEDDGFYESENDSIVLKLIQRMASDVLTIIEEPKDFEGKVGDTAEFTVKAANAASYQWYMSIDGENWSKSSTTPSISFSLTTAARMKYQVKCVVTGKDGTTYETQICKVVEKFNEIILDEVTYTINEDNTLTVKTYVGTASSVTIPQTVNGMTVTKIGEAAFEGNNNLHSIDLPDTIVVIGKAAFKNCSNLREMN